MTAGRSPGRRRARWAAVSFARLPALLAALALGLITAACGDLDRPFRKSDDPARAQGRPPPPPVVLRLSGDVPREAARRVGRALTAAAKRRGVRLLAAASGASSRTAPAAGGWRLEGDFEAFRDDGGRRRLAYVFRLRDDGGRIAEEMSGSEPVAEGPADPWQGIAPVALPRLAETVAERMAAHFALQGYGAQGAGLPPPPDALVEAGPGAEKEIDPDLLAGLPPPAGMAPLVPPTRNGAGAAPPVTERTADARRPRGATPPARGATAGRSAAAQETAAKTTRAEKAGAAEKARKGGAKRRGTRISSVAVLGVTGAPGRGNAELAQALRRVLRRAGWPVHAVRRDDALLVRGTVRLGRPRAGRQEVRITWTAKTPDGRVLGTVRQRNTVPAGALAEGFGAAAADVAAGAAEGLFRLVARLRGR